MTKKKIFTFDECKNIALKYSKRRDFKNKDRTCFNFAKENGWYEEITKHIKTNIPKHRTFDEVKEHALKYKTRMEFKKNDIVNYCYAVTHGWLDKVCEHMDVVGDLYNRCVYVYELPDNVCYIGLTYNLYKRDLNHRNPNLYSAVREYCENKNIEIPKPKQLCEYINSNIASKKEGEFLKEYLEKGWVSINRSKTGCLGGKKHLYKDKEVTEEFCKEIALKCNTKSEFMIKYQGLVKVCKANGWIDSVLEHFKTEEYKKKKSEIFSKALKGLKKNNENRNYDKISKPVIQLTKDGVFIKRYKSITEAAKELQVKSLKEISNCCKHKKGYDTCYGFKWEFDKDNREK